MTVTLVFLAVLMAAFAGWLISQSVNVKPWVAASPEAVRAHHWPAGLTAPRIALVVFLAVVTSLFALGVSAYLSRMEYGVDWEPVPEPGLLWLNTGVLVLASVALQTAWKAARQGNGVRLMRWLAAGGLLTVAFIAGQLIVWRGLADAGYYVASNPANAFFYLLTGLHALHLLGGLIAWTRPLVRLSRGGAPGEVLGAVELCAVYWHYLLAIWAALFAILLYS
ncbi:cytochrome c oxidase subunit 3 [Ectothiorhodospiraceae bacterium WFHF3C12]|nr:cytochrome c oxidase subunit 3 [Ectothiorhodospiraceae bacterium WFHF3C12]